MTNGDRYPEPEAKRKTSKSRPATSQPPRCLTARAPFSFDGRLHQRWICGLAASDYWATLGAKVLQTFTPHTSYTQTINSKPNSETHWV